MDYVSFNIATPVPKSELYEIAVRDKLLPPDFSFTNLRGWGKAMITTNEFNPEELESMRKEIWKKINFRIQAKKEKIAKMGGQTLKELELSLK